MTTTIERENVQYNDNDHKKNISLRPRPQEFSFYNDKSQKEGSMFSDIVYCENNITVA